MNHLVEHALVDSQQIERKIRLAARDPLRTIEDVKVHMQALAERLLSASVRGDDYGIKHVLELAWQVVFDAEKPKPLFDTLVQHLHTAA